MEFSDCLRKIKNRQTAVIKEGSLTVSQTDIAGKGIERSDRFLEKIAGLKINKNSPVWKEIFIIKRIRNQVAHENAKLTDKTEQKLGDVFR